MAVDEMKNPKTKNSRVNNLMREIAHAQKRNFLSDLREILQDSSYPRRNHIDKFGNDRLRGLGVARDQILAFPVDFDRRPYNTLALPCECVMYVCMYVLFLLSSQVSFLFLVQVKSSILLTSSRLKSI